MMVVVLVVAWFVLCIVATLAYVFGASVGIRRGLEQATADEPEAPHMPDVVAPRRVPVVVRLPEDANQS